MGAPKGAKESQFRALWGDTWKCENYAPVEAKSSFFRLEGVLRELMCITLVPLVLSMRFGRHFLQKLCDFHSHWGVSTKWAPSEHQVSTQVSTKWAPKWAPSEHPVSTLWADNGTCQASGSKNVKNAFVRAARWCSMVMLVYAHQNLVCHSAADSVCEQHVVGYSINLNNCIWPCPDKFGEITSPLAENDLKNIKKQLFARWEIEWCPWAHYISMEWDLGSGSGAHEIFKIKSAQHAMMSEHSCVGVWRQFHNVP